MFRGSPFTSEYKIGKGHRFAPFADLSDKANWSLHSFVEQDGSITEAIRLNVFDDRHREELIAFHYAQSYAKTHYRDTDEEPQFYVTGRDAPWDFEYVMHDGSSFFVEICRIADEALLRMIKIENDVQILLMNNWLRGYEIQKIEKHFPGTLPRDLVAKVVSRTDRGRRFHYSEASAGRRLFLRPPMTPTKDLVAKITTALIKKAQKKHAGKEQTTIILDNLTTHSSPDDFFEAFEDIADFLNDLPFASIWLYTGYYSDDNGYNCEYSLIPIKQSPQEQRFLDGVTTLP